MGGLNMYVPPKVKPLCPPEERPRFEDVPYARVTLDNGQAYTLKLDIYQSPEPVSYTHLTLPTIYSV